MEGLVVADIDEAISRRAGTKAGEEGEPVFARSASLCVVG